MMRIAKPMLLVSTPVGVAWGVVEAWRFHPWLAALMMALLTIVGIFIGYTVRTIQREQQQLRQTGTETNKR